MPQQDNVQRAIIAPRIFDGRAWHEGAAVLIDNGVVRAIADAAEIFPEQAQERLPDWTILAPGFIDLQVNGGGGVLLNDDPSPDAMFAIARAHQPFGTTGLLPTLITDARVKAMAAIAAARGATGKEGVIGLHLEGPFLNPARAGVHRKPYIAEAKMDDLEWLSALAGAGTSLITLAPECVPPGFIRALTSLGIRVCAGHSEASADIMQRAMDEGLSGVTHLFNAMPPFAGRSPGIVGTALADERLTAGIIVDGLHVDPVSVRAAFAAKGASAMALVTDAMPTVGSDRTAFDLLGIAITLKDGRLNTNDGTLAGAHLDMCSAVRNAVQLAHIPLEDALVSASRTPARFLGIADRGVIAPGTRADLVALTDDLRVSSVWIAGVRSDQR